MRRFQRYPRGLVSPGRWIRPGATSLLVLFFAGCGKPVRVDGRVLLDGKPLPGGRVTFLCDGGLRPALCSPIRENGEYAIQDPPLGRARVTVETFKQEPRPKLGIDPQAGIDPSVGWEDAGPYVPIPARYRSPKTSGIECMIAPGTQTFDIVLTK
jgi:hypothetical protein